MHLFHLSVACTERRKARQETVGKWLTIHLLDNGTRGEFRLLYKQLAQMVGKLTFQHIAHQSLADIGSASLIAQDVAQWRNIVQNLNPIVVA